MQPYGKWQTSQHKHSNYVQHLLWRIAQKSKAISWWCSPVLTALWVGRRGTGARTPRWWNSPVHYSLISGQMDQCYYTNNTNSLHNNYEGNTNRTMQTNSLQFVVKKITIRDSLSGDIFKNVIFICDYIS